MIPTFILQIWLLGLLSFGLVGGVAYLGHEWYGRSWGWDAALQRSVFAPDLGWNEDTAYLAGAVALLLVVFFGGSVVKLALRLFAGVKSASAGDAGTGSEVEDPRVGVRPASTQRLVRPDGSELQVEFYGPENGIPVVLTHGWGLHSAEWNYLKRELGGKFRLVVWDEPGLGKSTRPANRDYSLNNLARDLEAVLELVGRAPAILLGHSIGGMITLTFCKLFPGQLGTKVAGLVLTHTTPLNPVRTTKGAALYSAIETPVLKPLMYLTIMLSPLVWLMTWLSYRNGSAHLSAKRQSFAGTETWEEIDFAAGFQPLGPPAVLARGMLGMMEYDARAVLGEISVPVLVVAGDRDPVTMPVASEMIRAGVPVAELVTLSPAKHLGLVEHHEAYAKAVREFTHKTMTNMGRVPTGTIGSGRVVS